MKFVNKIELKLENFEKCYLVCEQDCQWGNIHDFAATLKSFAIQKIQESDQASKAADEEKKEA